MTAEIQTPDPTMWLATPRLCPSGQGTTPPAEAIDVATPPLGSLRLVAPSPDPTVPHPAPMIGASGQGTTPPVDAIAPARSDPHTLRLADPLLMLLADSLGDLESTRIANENRLRQLTRTGPDEDGIERGFGLDENQPDVARCAGIVTALADLEHQATLNLQRQMRKHPLGAWVKATQGVGEKQGARLLASIGDPYWNTLHDRPRTVSELWAYCGLHTLPAGRSVSDTQGGSAGGAPSSSDPGHLLADTPPTPAWVAAKRRKGVKSNWSGDAKMRAYLVAVSCMKSAKSPYRAVYLARRDHTAVTHPEWNAGHSHNDALRIASKAILRDLWREARRLHEEVTS